jgi:type IX secretion system PorP/SprF family membrane protein
MHRTQKIFLFIFSLAAMPLYAQQLPYYTQFKPNSVMLNPAVAGTKRFLDLRMDYRNQWVGFDANPKTEGFNINSRLMKGTMGVGLSLYKDQTGYTTRSLYSMAYSYHIRYPDIALSLGMSGNMIKYMIDGSQITTRNAYDQAINTAILAKTKAFDASAGLLLYNDRFHFGFSVLDMFSSKVKFFKDDTTHKSILKMVPHTFVSIGYNWAGDPRFVWENSVQANVISGSPLQVDYNLRVHYKEKVMAGFSIRRHDAVALHIGFTFREDLMVSYSYDIGISPLRTYHDNTHEILLVYSTNLPRYFGKHGDLKEFRRQKFGYMF